MVPTIGIMIGFYIVTRMASFLSRTGERTEAGIVRVLAIVTMVVAALAITSLLGGGSANSTP